MSALGSIFTSMVLVFAAVFSIGMLIGSTVLGHGLIREDLAAVIREVEQAKGSLQVINLTLMEDNKTVDAQVLNRDAGSLRISEFGKMDLILIYWSKKTESIEVKWIPYDPSCALGQGPCWSPLKVSYQGGSELTNPVSPDFGSGMWDSGEVLELLVKVEASDQIDSSKPVDLILVASNGERTP